MLAAQGTCLVPASALKRDKKAAATQAKKNGKAVSEGIHVANDQNPQTGYSPMKTPTLSRPRSSARVARHDLPQWQPVAPGGYERAPRRSQWYCSACTEAWLWIIATHRSLGV